MRRRCVRQRAGPESWKSQVQFLRGFFREGKIEHLTDVAFACAVEHGGCERNTLLQVFGQIDDFVIGQRIKVFLLTAALVVNRVQELTDLCDLLATLVLELSAILQPKPKAAQPK